ncbi:5-oxoprolinase subunit PxpB [Cupriavidus consociatus]|uniref:5-oxoprolinase subunit PxpB n=1 Tax=Cupriavidus consociatus TaxID=2821357 RepID=UPI001AE7CCA1|nr:MULTISPECIES: 5-oxoprolinase subunit PxpB [unclassified Cupriavidus]MBP0622369.1 5-oxoprolinase subunit PxpB [Cupriavidus sp. LEh25]MDK2659054.1 5-oxoprolinase subunit PxpB [Cupriavidus sp. LEh21]
MTLTLELAEPDNSVAARIHAAGSGALLLDASTGAFDNDTQSLLLSLASRLRQRLGKVSSLEVVSGVNNLLLTFDPLQLHPRDAEMMMRTLWESATPSRSSGKHFDIPVTYGGEHGEDLQDLAKRASLTVEDYIKRHGSAVYTVACVGSMPGFAYMTGLPDELAVPRRSTPRMKVSKGSVIVGGSQAGVMPCTAPSGWHIVGITDREMFDASNERPCLLAPGDSVRFSVKEVLL